mmetsp:Transcript_30360/g.92854  ORF Transcript_30360/g.92854 Transcript_30360/m.92854 type:complete len:227 (-) Transcript_30360:552-1232(-)
MNRRVFSPTDGTASWAAEAVAAVDDAAAAAWVPRLFAGLEALSVARWVERRVPTRPRRRRRLDAVRELRPLGPCRQLVVVNGTLLRRGRVVAGLLDVLVFEEVVVVVFCRREARAGVGDGGDGVRERRESDLGVSEIGEGLVEQRERPAAERGVQVHRRQEVDAALVAAHGAAVDDGERGPGVAQFRCHGRREARDRLPQRLLLLRLLEPPFCPRHVQHHLQPPLL